MARDHEGLRPNPAATMNRAIRVLFVCMGNICRSATAHGVFRAKVEAARLDRWISVESAGTHDYHAGEPPDSRSQAHAARRGYDLSDLRARVLRRHDFERADLLLVMDEHNFERARAMCPVEYRQKLQPLTNYCRRFGATEVPDPYSGGPSGFERVLDLVEDACDGLLDHLRAEGSAGVATIAPVAPRAAPKR